MAGEDDGVPRRVSFQRFFTMRWLGLTLLALVLVAACARLGLWQLDRAREVRDSVQTAASKPAVPISTLTTPSGSLPVDAVGRLVTVDGAYDPRSYLVAHRPSGGVDGSWVVSLLRTPGGAGVIVVRGWVAGTQAVAPPPVAGPVAVTGRLAPSDPPGGDLQPGTELPAGQLPAVDPVDLLHLVPYPLYDGYLVPVSQQPPETAALRPVPSPSAASSVPGFYLQHIAYVGLWWLFGAFVVWFWLRLVRDELADDRAGPKARLPA
jgi:cytochrome oxidase assembly protein ShyY1